MSEDSIGARWAIKPRYWRSVLLACLFSAWVSDRLTAHAYSDPASYDLPVLEGGGGGRWFTGTPADGYGCDVCHNAAGAVPVSVSGLPLDTGYAAGQSYEIGVRWPAELEHLALVLELVDDAGAPAGTLASPRPDAFRVDEQCSEEGAEGMPASGVVASEAGRQFATVIDCGARSLRTLWTAPTPAAGTVWLSGGLVASDDDASVENDVPVLIRRPIPPAGALAPVMELTRAGCSAATPGSAHGWSVFAFSLALMVSMARRRWGRRPVEGGRR